MAHRIYKYSLPDVALRGYALIEMPKGAVFLSVQVQHNSPVAWVRVDPDQEKVLREIRVVTTGRHVVQDDLVYLGTVQLNDGETVFHYFDKGEIPL